MERIGANIRILQEVKWVSCTGEIVQTGIENCAFLFTFLFKQKFSTSFGFLFYYIVKLSKYQLLLQGGIVQTKILVL